jgi:hypothetical protein
MVENFTNDRSWGEMGVEMGDEDMGEEGKLGEFMESVDATR